MGEQYVIRNYNNEKWLRSIEFGGTASSEGWESEYIDIYYYREVVGVRGDTLAVDAPLFNHFDLTLSRPIVYQPYRAHLVENSGGGHLRIACRTNGPNSVTHGGNGVLLRRIDN